jgi:hypothetical protein
LIKEEELSVAVRDTSMTNTVLFQNSRDNTKIAPHNEIQLRTPEAPETQNPRETSINPKPQNTQILSTSKETPV